MAEQEQPVRRQVALKIIKVGMDTKQVIARFEQERQALAIMEHRTSRRSLMPVRRHLAGHTSLWNWCAEFPSPNTAMRRG
jgi:hypothetical protein